PSSPRPRAEGRAIASTTTGRRAALERRQGSLGAFFRRYSPRGREVPLSLRDSFTRHKQHARNERSWSLRRPAARCQLVGLCFVRLWLVPLSTCRAAFPRRSEERRVGNEARCRWT